MYRKIISYILLFTCTVFLNSCTNLRIVSREDLKTGARVELIYTNDGKKVYLPDGRYCDKELFAWVTVSDNSMESYPVSHVLSIRTAQSKTINVTELKKDIKIFEVVLKDRTIKNVNYMNKYDRDFNRIVVGKDFSSIDFESITQARIEKPQSIDLDSLKIDTDYFATELVLKDTRYFPIKNVKFGYWGPYFTDVIKSMYINYDKVDSVMVKENDNVKSCFLSIILVAAGLPLVIILIFRMFPGAVRW